ncbi:cytochrome b5 reductase 4 [Podospora fimiseda]|uniref:Cytochrome b5 reductase 4 n=1 Tax=Podospora fimiseda TaxID=252190 RepID=A0AAN7H4Y0_9PEZI|nr:cytochrome b5 reductase 4 [Podospora fimiseda]
MALLGISLIVASLVLFCMRRPAWLPSLFGGGASWQLPAAAPEASSSSSSSSEPRDGKQTTTTENNTSEKDGQPHLRKAAADKAAMPPPPPPPPAMIELQEEQITPKATSTALETPVPSFSLSDPQQPPPPPPKPASSLMPPPPRPAPPSLRPTPRQPSSSSSLFPPRQPGSSTLAPPRQPGSSTLAPPPTHTSKPTKPSRTVILTPGHSPLDWARLSSSPQADLRNLPPGTPYLRVTPSQLKKMTGRRGKDAWSVFNGKVYNLTPYLPFHPGGEPELLRCAGRDGTQLFGEIHPWVNYEGMLSACLIGIYVTEEEEKGGEDMEGMD